MSFYILHTLSSAVCLYSAQRDINFVINSGVFPSLQCDSSQSSTVSMINCHRLHMLSLIVTYIFLEIMGGPDRWSHRFSKLSLMFIGITGFFSHVGNIICQLIFAFISLCYTQPSLAKRNFILNEITSLNKGFIRCTTKLSKSLISITKMLSKYKSCPFNTVWFVFSQNQRRMMPIHLKTELSAQLNYN